MGEVRYMISEAAKRVNVETHVLRYWEEELELPIGRTERDTVTIQKRILFRCIKELKEQGMFLKDLKRSDSGYAAFKRKKGSSHNCSAGSNHNSRPRNKWEIRTSAIFARTYVAKYHRRK